MARLFDDAASDYLKAASTPITAAPLTMACWFRSDDLTISQALMGIYDTNSGGAVEARHFRLFARGNVAGDPIGAITQQVGTQGIANTTTGYSANVWHHACAVFTSAASRTAYIDGGSSATETTSVTPTSLDAMLIGVRMDDDGLPVVGTHTSGDIAECAWWNVALSAAEVAILARGASPLMVRPSALVAYVPIMGVASPEINIRSGTSTFTLTGTAKSAHPRIFYPNRRFIIPVPSAAAAALSPSVSDSLTVSESAIASLMLPASVFDSISLAEFTDLDIPLPISASDSISVSEATDLDIPLPVSASDSIVTNEFTDLDIPLPAFAADAIAVAEAVDFYIPLPVSAFDSILVSEFTDLDIPLPVFASDSILVVENLSITVNPLNVSTSDSILTSEFTDLDIPLPVSVSDSILVGEFRDIVLAISIPSVLISIFDSISASEFSFPRLGRTFQSIVYAETEGVSEIWTTAAGESNSVQKTET